MRSFLDLRSLPGLDTAGIMPLSEVVPSLDKYLPVHRLSVSKNFVIQASVRPRLIAMV